MRTSNVTRMHTEGRITHDTEEKMAILKKYYELPTNMGQLDKMRLAQEVLPMSRRRILTQTSSMEWLMKIIGNESAPSEKHKVKEDDEVKAARRALEEAERRAAEKRKDHAKEAAPSDVETKLNSVLEKLGGVMTCASGISEENSEHFNKYDKGLHTLGGLIHQVHEKNEQLVKMVQAVITTNGGLRSDLQTAIELLLNKAGEQSTKK